MDNKLTIWKMATFALGLAFLGILFGGALILSALGKQTESMETVSQCVPQSTAGSDPFGQAKTAQERSNQQQFVSGQTSTLNLEALFRQKPLNAEQRKHAQMIYDIGFSRGFSIRDIKIALMTSYQESELKNLDFGDRDSLGLFQQRPSQGWGTRAQILDPTYAINKFYSAFARVTNRENQPLIEVAIKTQRPSRAAYNSPQNRFMDWESPVDQMLQMGGTAVACDPQTTATNDAVEKGIQIALAQDGAPYVWGGTSPYGFDCSGLMQWAFAQVGINLPRVAVDQYNTPGSIHVTKEQLQRGDLIFWGYSANPSAIHHEALYLGDGMMLEAPNKKVGRVRIRDVYYGSEFIGGTRLAAPVLTN